MDDPINYGDTIEETIRTRSGYPARDVLKNFKQYLEQPGAEASAKCLHYSADLITSGCMDVWQKVLWDYAFDHVSMTNVRIFLFLKQQFDALQASFSLLPSEDFYKRPENQKIVGTCVLILRSIPRRPPLKMPKVGPETHSDAWLDGALNHDFHHDAVLRTFKPANDAPILRKIGEEFIQACKDGATERALFWMKWVFDEEQYLKREQQAALSTFERGPSTWNKQRNHASFFIGALLLEMYKELSRNRVIRMDEEFKALFLLYFHPYKPFSQKRRCDLLSLMIQIVCEVPRWKVPACPELISDPVKFNRALGHIHTFFQEVLAYDAPSGNVTKEVKKGNQAPTGLRKLNNKQLALAQMERKFEAYDSAFNSAMGF